MNRWKPANRLKELGWREQQRQQARKASHGPVVLEAPAGVQLCIDTLAARANSFLEMSYGVPTTHAAFRLGRGFDVTWLLGDALPLEGENLEGTSFMTVGAGCFSIVLRSPDLDRVYGQPVVLKVSMLEQDYGPQFWAYCQQHAQNPDLRDVLPRIFARGRDTRSGYRWCVSELLSGCNQCDLSELHSFKHSFEVQAVLQDMAKLAETDLHYGNIMRRFDADGEFYQLVVNDPVSLSTEDKQVWHAW